MGKRGILGCLLLLSLLFTACSNGRVSGEYLDIMAKPTEERYAPTEIRDYKGVRLDASIGPRDNSISGIPRMDPKTYRLEITGLVETPLQLTYDEVLAFPVEERLITLYCVEGWQATILWKGVKLLDLLQEASPTATGKVAIFRCLDGYTTSLPLTEIEAKDMLLAYASNGIPLPEPLGYPFIVVAQDKLGYKWARWVETIEISDNPDYEGTWEKSGYDNEANVP